MHSLHRKSDEHTEWIKDSLGHIDLLHRKCDQLTDSHAKLRQDLVKVERMASRPVETDTLEAEQKEVSLNLPLPLHGKCDQLMTGWHAQLQQALVEVEEMARRSDDTDTLGMEKKVSSICSLTNS